MHGVSLDDDSFSSCNNLGISIELGHDFATKFHGIDEVIAEPLTLGEVMTSTRSQEGFDGTSGEDPSEEPDLSFPEVSSQELVSSIDMVPTESVSLHQSTNGGLEGFFKPTRFGEPEELVHGVLNMLDDVDLSDGPGDLTTDRSGPVEVLVQKAPSNADDLATNSPDDSDSTATDFLDTSTDGPSGVTDTSLDLVKGSSESPAD